MKRLIGAAVILMMLTTLMMPVMAQEEDVSVTIPPGHALYNLKLRWEKWDEDHDFLVIPAGNESRVRARIIHAERRMNELRWCHEHNRTECIDDVAEKYEYQIRECNRLVNASTDISPELLQHLEEVHQIHITKLETVKERIAANPHIQEEKKEMIMAHIDHAINESQKSRWYMCQYREWRQEATQYGNITPPTYPPISICPRHPEAPMCVEECPLCHDTNMTYDRWTEKMEGRGMENISDNASQAVYMPIRLRGR
ncbi:MAG: hypothetical protein IB616_05645 [Methanosarcinales archaeon]|nr:MAG: hypothetical protein IB616_05645 [Methanosarcinales archaeon]